MAIKLYVPLQDRTADMLRELARRELRDPKTQAAYLIITGLRAAGMEPEPEPAQAPAARPDATR